MDSTKATFLALKIVVFITTVTVASGQIECYSCFATYSDDTTVSNCINPDSDTSVTANCNGDCYTQITLNSGSINVQRGCEPTASDCTDCTDPEDCRICCDGSDKCNSVTLGSLLESKALVQTCYRCRYSEIPGVHSDSGCELAFDPNGAGVETIRCPGMCYSASSYIPGVEDIYRGCAYFGNGCDVDLSDTRANTNERNSVSFKRSCCMGDNCNGVSDVRAGSFVVVASALVVAIIRWLE